MSQRVDSNGKPAVGWLLYLYAANSSTPVNIYQDTGLTVLATWPLQADANGMMPPFWLADGSYRVRGTSGDASIIYFDIQSVLALGASSGGGGGGGVDPTTIFQTGDVIWVDVQGVRAGWVRDNGRTIGSATSGASERANADCQPLFIYLWNNFPDAFCPVLGGRGASGLADFNANKQITTPDKRGVTAGGLDDMGNSARGAYSGVPILSGGYTSPGSLVGENNHTLSTGEIPSHQHINTLNDPGHTHNAFADHTGGLNNAVFDTGNAATQTGTAIQSNTTGITINNAAAGGGGGHNNVEARILGTFFRKL